MKKFIFSLITILSICSCTVSVNKGGGNTHDGTPIMTVVCVTPQGDEVYKYQDGETCVYVLNTHSECGASMSTIK